MLLGTIRLYWKTFVITTFAVFAAGVAWLVIPPLQYVSTTELLVSINGSTTASAYQNDDIVANRINSYIPLLTSDAAAQRVIDKLDLPITPAEFAAKVSATNVPPKTSLIDVTVTDTSPSQAQRLADTLAQEFVSFTDAIEAPTGEDGQKVRTSVVSTASQPRTRFKKRLALGGLIALAAPLMGAVAVWTRSQSDRIVRTSAQAAAAAKAPTLGRVAAFSTGRVDMDDWRRLRSRLRSTVDAETSRVWLLASTVGEIDAAEVSSKLGQAMQLGGSRTVVLDASSEAPSVKDLPESDDDHSGAVTLRQPDTCPDTIPQNVSSAEADGMSSTVALIEELRGEYQELIFASPPVLNAATASDLSGYADVVLLLSVAGTTKRRDLARASRDLTSIGAPVAGVILISNDCDDNHPATDTSRDPQPTSRRPLASSVPSRNLNGRFTAPPVNAARSR